MAYNYDIIKILLVFCKAMAGKSVREPEAWIKHEAGTKGQLNFISLIKTLPLPPSLL